MQKQGRDENNNNLHLFQVYGLWVDMIYCIVSLATSSGISFQSSIKYGSILRPAETIFALYISLACEERFKMFSDVRFIVLALHRAGDPENGR